MGFPNWNLKAEYYYYFLLKGIAYYGQVKFSLHQFGNKSVTSKGATWWPGSHAQEVNGQSGPTLGRSQCCQTKETFKEGQNSPNGKSLQFWRKLNTRSSRATFSEMFSVTAIGSDRTEVSAHAWINGIRKKDILTTAGRQNLYKRTFSQVKTQWYYSYFKNLLAPGKSTRTASLAREASRIIDVLRVVSY